MQTALKAQTPKRSKTNEAEEMMFTMIQVLMAFGGIAAFYAGLKQMLVAMFGGNE